MAVAMKSLFLSVILVLMNFTLRGDPCTGNSGMESQKTNQAQEPIPFSYKTTSSSEEEEIVESSGIYRENQRWDMEEEDCDQRSGHRWRCLICDYCNAFWDNRCVRCNRDQKGDKCK
jgi:hypothetical protein